MGKMEPRAYVLFLLARREYPRADLIRKLVRREVAREDAEGLLDSLREEGWFREEAYAEARVRQWVRKGLGTRAITARARAERIRLRDGEIERAYDLTDSTPEAQARALIRKQLRQRLRGRDWRDLERAEARDLKAKVLRSVASKGHPIPLALRIFDEETKRPAPSGT